MKIPLNVVCDSCKTVIKAIGHGENDFPTVICPKCELNIHIIDPLSISVIADRLMLRSQSEMQEGDFTLSIICSAMAVESALTKVFTKWKSIELFEAEGRNPTAEEEEVWEKEYREGTAPGGFERSANFVSTQLCGKSHDEFVGSLFHKAKPAALIRTGLPPQKSHAKTKFINRELFVRRNRIMHWGEVNYKQADAQLAFDSGLAAIAVLKQMDVERYEAMEAAHKKLRERPR